MGITFKASPTNRINPWQNKAMGYGFWCHNRFIVWMGKNQWNHVFIDFGIRRSDIWQIFPIWIEYKGYTKSIMFGFWKLYFQIGYKK